MAKIGLAKGGFTLIPEGVTTFKITEVEYKEDFGKMVVAMQTKSGQTHQERFTLINNKGEVNEGALKAFSYFAKTALNNFNVEEIDDQDLVGCYIQATVKHEEYERTKGEKAGEKAIAVRLNDYAVASGFGGNTSSADPIEDEDDEDVDLDDFLD